MCYNCGKEESVELRKHFNLQYVFVGLYILFFCAYVVVGLNPAGALDYVISSDLKIPSIGLKTDVAALSIEDGNLNTPDTIVGSYSRFKNTTLLIGHSTTVFRHLDNLQIGDEIVYNNSSYYIVSRRIQEKTDISMAKLLKESYADTLVLMTCAGELLGNGDATHRLIVTAIRY